VRACAATADQLDRRVITAASRPHRSLMLSLAVRGLAFGLVEELVADGAQLWVGIGDG
jgi:hypothetical protein